MGQEAQVAASQPPARAIRVAAVDRKATLMVDSIRSYIGCQKGSGPGLFRNLRAKKNTSQVIITLCGMVLLTRIFVSSQRKKKCRGLHEAPVDFADFADFQSAAAQS